LTVTVTDDGVGVPADFDLDTSMHLGLSIVRTLVESEMGGQLSVQPGSSGGTRVLIDVPQD
jgi:two-component sensor histidine kinase